MQNAECRMQDANRATSVDFADALIGLVNQADGCDHTLTFDRSLKRIPQFKVI